MDVAQVFRAVRRHRQWSQRELAARSGVAHSTVTAVEAGRQSPSATVIDRVLAAAGLDLALGPRNDMAADERLRRHLRLSLTQRLRLALGESPVLLHRTTGDAWRELAALARRGRVLLAPPLAVAMWVPVGRVQQPSVTVFHARAALASDTVRAQPADGDLPKAAIPFMLDVGERVWVLPPGELALPTAAQSQLQRADRLLHADAPVDDADRRRPAHRDTDDSVEDWRLLRTKSVRLRPDMRDGRGWRLGAPASLAQQLRRL